MSVKEMTTRSDNNKPLMPALTGIRIFAIFHIFCFHMWTLHTMEKPAEVANMLSGMNHLPDTFLTFITNGWMSTSFFFVLSGFILAYLYWGRDGKLTVPKRTFWISRMARIYPIHIFLLLVTILGLAGYKLSLGVEPATLILSAIANLALLQAWIPTYVPIWSWPTWTISALIFLYFLMPFIMSPLARLARRSAIILLCLLPLLSLIPTAIYAFFFPTGSEPQQFWQIFIGSTPIFWLAHFVAGMLLSRIFTISRYSENLKHPNQPWLAWGDLALLLVIIIACVPGIQEPFKFFLRHGLMLPLYMVIILDLARGKGIAARFFSLPGMTFMGETGFSVFIWQNLVMMGCGVAVMANPNAGENQFYWALIAMILIGIFSTYVMEKPFARFLRRKLLDNRNITLQHAGA